MQEVVASHMKSDATWWKIPVPFAYNTEVRRSKLVESILHWYQICRSSLTEISFGIEDDELPRREDELMSLSLSRALKMVRGRISDPGNRALNCILKMLISQSPSVRSLNLGILLFCKPPIYSNISSFLRCIQSTLKHITVYFSDEVFNCAILSNFPHLTSLEMIYHCHEASRMPELIRHFARKTRHFSNLHLEHTCRYGHIYASPKDLPDELMHLIPELPLHSLVLKTCEISNNMFNCIISHPTLSDLQLKQCNWKELTPLLENPNLVSRVENFQSANAFVFLEDFQSVFLKDLEHLAKCPRLQHFSVKQDCMSQFVPEYVSHFRALSELSISLPGQDGFEEVEALLVRSITDHHSLVKLELYIDKGDSSDDTWLKGLKISSIEQLLISQKDTLECLVVGMRRPYECVYERSITELLKLVRYNNPKLRKFRLMTGLERDQLRELLQKLRKEIDLTERVIEGLKIEIQGSCRRWIR